MPLSEADRREIDARFRQLLLLYPKVKRYIIASEKVSSDNKLSIPAINELRNAFDHEMRAQAVLTGAIELPNDTGMTEADYCLANLSKAIGHVYRAGYDALDVISLAIATEIKRVCENAKVTTLVTVFPDYSNDIRLPLFKAIETCEEAKAMKDVEAGEAGHQHFHRYEQAIADLQIIRERLFARAQEIQQVENESRSHTKRERNVAYAIAGVSILIGIVLWWFPHESSRPLAKPAHDPASHQTP